MVDISQVVMRISSQISQRVTGEGSFAKGFAISSDLSRPFLSRKNLGDIEVVHVVVQTTVVQSSQRDYVQYRGPTCGIIKAKILVNSSIVSGSL